MPILRVEHISKSFGGLKALEDLSFSAEKKEITSIIGPNGAGKSTVFNCINGLYRPEEGEIWLESEQLIGLRPDQVARQGIARTFQNLELFKYMTTIENLLLGRHLHMHASLLQILGLGIKNWKASQEEIQHRHRVEEIIDFLDLQPYRNHPVFALPYGIQKLVEMGRALALNPKVLLLDEPAAGLNNEERQDMIFWIKDIRDEWNITIVVIEHNMQLVKDISDRVLAINFGKKITEGTIDEVLSHEEVIRAYLGEAIG